MNNTLVILKNKILFIESEVKKAENNFKAAEEFYNKKLKELDDYKTALIVFEEIDNEDKTEPSGVDKLTIKQQIILLIKEATSDISTGDIIDAYCKKNGVNKKKARNSIYPNLSGLKEEGVIEPYKHDPKANGSFWRLKEKP